jgi:transcriptional regulator with XRE-family HTH domain
MLYFHMLEIGHQIYLYRLRQGMTQRELSKQAGIPQPNLSNIEKGKQDITVSTLQRIAIALRTPIQKFFSEVNLEKRGTLSRDRIQSIVEWVVLGSGRIGREEKVIGQNLKMILFLEGVKAPRRQETERAWMDLREILNREEIKVLCERIRAFEKIHLERDVA